MTGFVTPCTSIFLEDMRRFCKYIILLGFLGGTLLVQAQRSLVYLQENLSFERGLELFERDKYGPAREHFQSAIENADPAERLLISEASYYRALCAARLFNEDAGYELFRFVAEHSESPRVNEAWFEMGKYYYYEKQWSDATRAFEATNPFRLNERDRQEYYFKKGYTYFQRNKYNEARKAFYEMKDSDSPFASPATYYYAHIHYELENYETALENFLNLSEDETFSPLVPYYVTQIYYLQKKYEQVTEYAPKWIDSVTEKRKPEMSRILGESFYYLEDYQQALSYLKIYHEANAYALPEEQYQYAFSCYMTGDYETAIEYFKRVARRKSQVQQNAQYHLGASFLEMGDKDNARMAFGAAASMDQDAGVKEEALYNFAVLTYELSYSPFNEAIRALNLFINSYPASDRTDQAYAYLVDAYLNTKNFKDALSSLEKIRIKTPEISRAYQRVAFYRGLELFNDLRFNEAVNKFDLSEEYSGYDAEIAALCQYWKGETGYQLKDFETAENYYKRFINNEDAFNTPYYAIAHYNLGYIYFREKKYGQAANWFRKFTSLIDSKTNRLLADAYNRLGDICFGQSNYARSIDYYDKNIEMDLMDQDYALFQKAFALGLMQDHQAKINILSNLLVNYTESQYRDDAHFEMGKSHTVLNQTERAISHYQKILDNFGDSPYASKALVQLGLVYFNQDMNQKAIEVYKRAVEKYPGTEEARSALTGIKNVYVAANRVDEYFAYVESLGEAVNISRAEQDSLTYLAAENVYMEDKCEEAIVKLGNYIENYENGDFLLNAHFYKADCHFKLDEPDEALESLEYIIQAPRNAFTEQALDVTAEMYFERGEYARALERYLMLDQYASTGELLTRARLGKMRCYFILEEYNNTTTAAREVLLDNKLSKAVRREARYKIATSFYRQERYAIALEEYKKISDQVKSVEGAEAKYRVAEILFKQEKFNVAENEIFDFIQMNTPHQYWLAKSFLLLANMYMIKNDAFQALQTLQSIIDYYENMEDGILEEAKSKKEEILRIQEEKERPAQDKPVEISIGEGSE